MLTIGPKSQHNPIAPGVTLLGQARVSKNKFYLRNLSHYVLHIWPEIIKS